MKKKAFIKIFVISLIFTLLLSLASCGEGDEPVGISKIRINADGELIITYTDGEKENLGVIVGEDGKDGKDGIDGKDGKDGKDGEDGKDGVDGIDGEDGKDGINGTDGTDGINGTNAGAGQNEDIQTASAKGLTSSVNIFCTFEKTPFLGSTEEYASAGAGVIYKMNKAAGEAFIITNYHVVYDPECDAADGISEKIEVYLYGALIQEKAMVAEYVGGSLTYDIAVLRIKDSDVIRNSDVNPVSIFDSEAVNVGESAIAIGNPEGNGFSTSLGIVSVDSEYIEMTGADGVTDVQFRVMRIDTAVNGGNSGGGLFNSKGELIGIVNAKIQSTTVENIAYAIPSNLAIAVADNIIYYCLDTDVYQPQRPILGIMIQITDSHAEYDSVAGRIKIVEKIEVITVSEGTASYGVFEVGDVLKSASCGGETYEINRLHSVEFMFNARPGDKVSFVVERDGAEQTLEFTIEDGDLVAS